MNVRNEAGRSSDAERLYGPLHRLENYQVKQENETELRIFLDYWDPDNKQYGQLRYRLQKTMSIRLATQILQLAQSSLDQRTVKEIERRRSAHVARVDRVSLL